MRHRCQHVLLSAARRHPVAPGLSLAKSAPPRHAFAACFAAAPVDSGSRRHVTTGGGESGPKGAWQAPPTSTRKIEVQRAKDAVAEASNSGAEVLRAKAASAEASKTAAGIAADEYDSAALSELGLTLDSATGGTGTFYLRIHCRMTNPPGPPSPPNVSTHTAKAVLGQCGLPIDSFQEDHSGECVIVVTSPGTAEALVFATVEAICKSNGAATFGRELSEPSMLRVLANNGDDSSTVAA